VEVWGIPASRIASEVSRIVDEVLGDWRSIRDGFVARRWRIY
jgi:hypothetical protein